MTSTSTAAATPSGERRKLDISYPVGEFTRLLKAWDGFDESAMGIAVRYLKSYESSAASVWLGLAVLHSPAAPSNGWSDARWLRSSVLPDYVFGGKRPAALTPTAARAIKRTMAGRVRPPFRCESLMCCLSFPTWSASFVRFRQSQAKASPSSTGAVAGASGTSSADVSVRGTPTPSSGLNYPLNGNGDSAPDDSALMADDDVGAQRPDSLKKLRPSSFVAETATTGSGTVRSETTPTPPNRLEPPQVPPPPGMAVGA